MDNLKHSDLGGVNLVLTKNASSEALRQLGRQLAPNMIIAAQERHWIPLALAGTIVLFSRCLSW